MRSALLVASVLLSVYAARPTHDTLVCGAEWTPVFVDDTLPCSPRSSGGPVFAHSRSGTALWMCVLEKALAKVYG